MDVPTEEIELLSAFEQTIFPEGYLTKEALCEQLRKPGAGYFLKRDTQGTPLGYALFVDDDGIRDVLRLGVQEQHRDRGIGSHILCAVTHDAFFPASSPRCRSTLLSVEKDNLRARVFYIRHNFVPIGHTDTHYLLELKNDRYPWNKYYDALRG